MPGSTWYHDTKFIAFITQSGRRPPMIMCEFEVINHAVTVQFQYDFSTVLQLWVYLIDKRLSDSSTQTRLLPPVSRCPRSPP
jgi:hypothetical protein